VPPQFYAFTGDNPPDQFPRRCGGIASVARPDAITLDPLLNLAKQFFPPIPAILGPETGVSTS